MRIILSKKWRAALLTWLILLVAGTSFVYRNGLQVYGYLRERFWYSVFASGSGDVRSDLANGRFTVGSPVEDIIAAYPPRSIVRNSKFTGLQYYRINRWSEPDIDPHQRGESTWVWARDGRIIAAGTGWYLGQGGQLNLLGELTRADRLLFLALQTAEDRDSLGSILGGAGIARP